MTLPDRLKQIRKAVRASQKQVAERVGITPAQLGSYERDKTTPSVPVLIAIADYYGVTLDYLVGRKD